MLLKNGKTIRGVARNRTNYSLQLQDADGKLHLLSMHEVSRMSVAKGSLMPKDFGKRLDSQEVDNILAYLSRQSVRPVDPKEKVK